MPYETKSAGDNIATLDYEAFHSLIEKCFSPDKIIQMLKLYKSNIDLDNIKDNKFYQYIAALYHHYGVSTPENRKTAYQLFKKAENSNLATAEHMLGYYNQKGIATKQDEQAAFNLYRSAANQGYAKAQNSLAECYNAGLGVLKNQQQAAIWFKKAADSGVTEAQYNTGVYYYKGNVITQNIPTAIKYFKMAASKDHIKACEVLGHHYYNLKNPNYTQAIQCYSKAALQGSPKAQCNLALCYFNGNGVPKDQKKAARLFDLAAEAGISQALYSLGFCYENGYGVNKDINKAAGLYTQSSIKGHSDAKVKIITILKNENTDPLVKLYCITQLKNSDIDLINDELISQTYDLVKTNLTPRTWNRDASTAQQIKESISALKELLREKLDIKKALEQITNPLDENKNLFTDISQIIKSRINKNSKTSSAWNIETGQARESRENKHVEIKSKKTQGNKAPDCKTLVPEYHSKQKNYYGSTQQYPSNEVRVHLLTK